MGDKCVPSPGRGLLCAVFINLILVADATADSRRHPLPHLPDMEHYLNDVIVLPKNYDAIDVLVIDLETRDTLVTCNVNEQNKFRLREGNCTLPEVKSGMVLECSKDATVLIYFGKYSLLLPVIEELGKEYFLITSISDERRNTLSNVFIYPSTANTSVQICFNQAGKTGGQINKFPPTSQNVPGPQNCSYITLLNYEGLVLNDTESSQETEIRANSPFGILQWYRDNASSDVRNGLESNDQQGQFLSIIWRRYLPVNAWGKTFVYPPTDNNQIPEFQLISDNNSCSIFISSEGDNKTEILNGTFTFTIGSGGWVYINSTCRVILRYRHESVGERHRSIWHTLTPLDVFHAQIDPKHQRHTYQWLYAIGLSSLDIIYIKTPNETIHLIADTDIVLPLNISETCIFGTIYSLTRYGHLHGLYKLYFDTESIVMLRYNSAETMAFVLSPQSNISESISVISPKDVARNPNIPYRKKDFNTSEPLPHSVIKSLGSDDNFQMISPNDTEFHFFSVSNSSDQRNSTSMKRNTTSTLESTKQHEDKNVLTYTNNTAVPQLDKQTDKMKKDDLLVNATYSGQIGSFTESLSTLSSETVDETIHVGNKTNNVQTFGNSSESNANLSEVQQTGNTATETANLNSLFTKINISNVEPTTLTETRKTETSIHGKYSDYAPGDKFRAVVDIVESYSDHDDFAKSHITNTVTKHSNVNPPYLHKADTNGHYFELTNDKSLMAIIISLCTALLAVVAIIFIFFLIEFFSRRRQIRKTRIRPFVSYY